jgi:hypothetical protein
MTDDWKGTVLFIAGEMTAIKKHAAKTRSSISNKHTHLLRRVTDLEESFAELTETIDELKQLFLNTSIGLTDSAGGTPSRNGKRERRLHPDPIIPGCNDTQ